MNVMRSVTEIIGRLEISIFLRTASHRTIISRRVKIDKVFPYSKYKFLEEEIRCCSSGILLIVYGLDVPWIIYGRLVFKMAPEEFYRSIFGFRIR